MLKTDLLVTLNSWSPPSEAFNWVFVGLAVASFCFGLSFMVFTYRTSSYYKQYSKLMRTVYKKKNTRRAVKITRAIFKDKKFTLQAAQEIGQMDNLPVAVYETVLDNIRSMYPVLVPMLLDWKHYTISNKYVLTLLDDKDSVVRTAGLTYVKNTKSLFSKTELEQVLEKVTGEKTDLSDETSSVEHLNRLVKQILTAY